MKHLWITTALLTGVLWTHSARASYVESCNLTATVLKPTSTMRVYLMDSQGNEFEEFRLKLSVRITQAQADGRADSGCLHFINKEMEIDITQPPAMAFKKGVRVYLHYFAKDGESLPLTKNFTLIPTDTPHTKKLKSL